jgi:hypothetical protein
MLPLPLLMHPGIVKSLSEGSEKNFGSKGVQQKALGERIVPPPNQSFLYANSKPQREGELLYCISEEITYGLRWQKQKQKDWNLFFNYEWVDDTCLLKKMTSLGLACSFPHSKNRNFNSSYVATVL